MHAFGSLTSLEHLEQGLDNVRLQAFPKESPFGYEDPRQPFTKFSFISFMRSQNEPARRQNHASVGGRRSQAQQSGGNYEETRIDGLPERSKRRPFLGDWEGEFETRAGQE